MGRRVGLRGYRVAVRAPVAGARFCVVGAPASLLSVAGAPPRVVVADDDASRRLWRRAKVAAPRSALRCLFAGGADDEGRLLLCGELRVTSILHFFVYFLLSEAPGRAAYVTLASVTGR